MSEVEISKVFYCTRFWWGNLKIRDPLEDLDVDGR
jgi:hypothetical protein